VESMQGEVAHVIGSGLTHPEFTEPASDMGLTKYVVMSVNANGQSVRSAVASIVVQDVPFPRHKH
jgi:hypothetical protein